MTRRRHVVRVLVTIASLLVLVVAPRAHAATRFVADTGTDGGGCGVVATTPCRSITQAIAKNNMFANGCGLQNVGVIGLAATNNYWGAPTGPGAGAADITCEALGGTTDVTPFATKPFAVTILKP